MKQILAHHNKYQAIIILLAADSLFFSLTNPQKVASWLLIVGILLFLASFYYGLLGVLAAARWYGFPAGRRPRRFAKVLAVVIGSLVALQSIGELSSRDIWVLVPLGVIAYLYSNKAFTRSQNAS